jgi:hypothetical protein
MDNAAFDAFVRISPEPNQIDVSDEVAQFVEFCKKHNFNPNENQMKAAEAHFILSAFQDLRRGAGKTWLYDLLVMFDNARGRG